MNSLFKKRAIALILAVCLIVGSVNFIVINVWDKMNETYALSEKDRALAEDLASMTGKTADSLLRMKSTSGSWNDVVSNLGNLDMHEKMSDKHLQDLLSAEGFSETEISEATMFVEQVLFNLNEILRNETPFEAATVAVVNDKSDNKSEAFRKLGQEFDKNLAAYFALKLQGEFIYMQSVIDEYLYCLQIGVDLNLLIYDKEAYEKAVLEKSAQLLREDAITMNDISARVIEALQPGKSDISSNAALELSENSLTGIADKIVINTPKGPRPPDPAQEAMDEIDSINNSWMSGW